MASKSVENSIRFFVVYTVIFNNVENFNKKTGNSSPVFNKLKRLFHRGLLIFLPPDCFYRAKTPKRHKGSWHHFVLPGIAGTTVHSVATLLVSLTKPLHRTLCALALKGVRRTSPRVPLIIFFVCIFIGIMTASSMPGVVERNNKNNHFFCCHW